MKIQMAFPDSLIPELREAAAEEGVSLPELIRRTMTHRLADRKRHEDPFGPITDLVSSDETDLSARVDSVVYR